MSVNFHILLNCLQKVLYLYGKKATLNRCKWFSRQKLNKHLFIDLI